MQDDLTRVLDAACHADVELLDVRGTPLSESANAAAQRVLHSSTSMRLLRVTAATPVDKSALTAAADNALRSIVVHVAAPPRTCSVPPNMRRMPGLLRPQSAAQHVPVSQAARKNEGTRRAVRAQSADCGRARSTGRPSAAGSLSSTVCTVSRKQPYPCTASVTPSLKPRVSNLPAQLPDRAHAAGISAGGASDRAAAVFLRADTCGDGVISSAKVADALNELGLLADLPPSQVHTASAACY